MKHSLAVILILVIHLFLVKIVVCNNSSKFKIFDYKLRILHKKNFGRWSTLSIFPQVILEDAVSKPYICVFSIA